MAKKFQLKGGCLCGALRYVAHAQPFDADYCHCSMCRKSAGSAFVVWMDFKRDQVVWEKGAPSEYSSSHSSFRGFCPTCGSTISFRDNRAPDYYSLAVCTLDDPNLVEPQYHIHTDSMPHWLLISDDLPRHAKGRSASKK